MISSIDAAGNLLGTVVRSFEALRFSGDCPGESVDDGAAALSSIEQRARHAFLLQNKVKVTPELFPGLSATFEGVKEQLRIDSGVECFIWAESELEAYCANLGSSFESEEAPLVAVALSSGIVNLMSDEELAVIMGHELGHFLFSHRTLPRPSEDQPYLERLNAMQLSRAAEITADRIGFICCSKMETCFQAMLKTVSGLSGEHFRTNVSAYLDQLREDQEILEHSEEIWSTHPMFPLRVKALLLFSMSQAYYTWVGRSDPAPISTEEMDSMIEKAFTAICGMRMGEIHSDVTSRVKLWGSLRLFVVDKRLSKSEQAALKQFFGEDTARSAIGFLEGQVGGVVGAVEAKLSEVLLEARELPEDKRESLIGDLERCAGAAGGENSTIIEALTCIAKALGINRPVRILPLGDIDE